MDDVEYELKVEQQKRWENYLRELAAKRPPRTAVLPPVPLVWPERSNDLRHASAVARVVIFHRKIKLRHRVIRWMRARFLKETDGPSFR